MSFLAVAAIVLTGLAANDPTPGVYVETNFAQGDVAGSAAERPMVVLANRISTGTATLDTVIYGPDTLIQCQTEWDITTLAGAGSEAHRLFRRITKINRDTAIYWVFVTESAGAKATGTVTAATTATGAGSLRIWVGDEFVDTGFISGDTPTVIAAAAVLNINARTHWPVTAGNSSGVITITAKQNGLRGNDIRYMSAIVSNGSVATTASPLVDTAMTSGATADSSTTALATILPRYFYYIVSAASDATQVGAASTQVALQASPTTGLRQRLISGCTDTLANAITLATGINAARVGIVWQEKSPFTPAELAANFAAVIALFELGVNPRTNFCYFGNEPETQPYWVVPKSRVDSAAPTRASIKSALNNGLSPIQVNGNGTTNLVSAITTRSLSGSTVDYRVRPWHKVTVTDRFTDDWQAKMILQNSGCRIIDNPIKGQAPPGGKVRWPDLIKLQTFGLLDAYAANTLIQNVDQIKDRAVFQRETNPSTRMTARIPLQIVDNLEQLAGAVDQVA